MLIKVIRHPGRDCRGPVAKDGATLRFHIPVPGFPHSLPE